MFVVEHFRAGEPYRASRFELGYALGLIVGEGSFTGDRISGCLSVKLHATDPEPLLLLQRIFGGIIYGPYLHGGRHYRVWHLRGDDLYDALPAIFAELPQSRKREQLEEWAKKYGFRSRKKAVPEDPELDYW